MKTLVSFATRWGPQFGGINSFNQDLLKAFAAAYSQHTQTVCIVLYADEGEKQEAKNCQIRLVSLDLESQKEFSEKFSANAWQALLHQGFTCDLNQTIWLGHDRITGGVALNAATNYGGRSALIHHMSYDHYESFSENSVIANKKTKEQQELFKQAGIVMTVGPLLRDALADMLDRTDIPMLVPGLPDIQVKNVIRAFRVLISGRLSDDAKKIKQGHLGVAAFSRAIQKADSDSGLPDILRGACEPELTLRGVDFEKCDSDDHADAEIELKLFAEKYAGRAIRMHALPFTTDRNELFNDVRSASATMMPSWHEGFGLVGWEAIAAGVPLIVSKKSGLYHLLLELDNGLYTSLVYPIDIAGSIAEPFFQEKDQEALACQIIEIAKSPDQARAKAVRLREELLRRYSWSDCARSLADILGWMPAFGSLAPSPESKPSRLEVGVTAGQSSSSILKMPCPTWQAGAGLSNSLLLQAEEAVIPFDSDREPFLKEQLQWANSAEFPISIRLLTGVGGTGKTRLALELCIRLQKQGWQTGFLPNDVRAGNTARSFSISSQPVCLIIDYAETRQKQLLDLVKTLRTTKGLPQIRIVLLARDSGEWWGLLPAKDSACEAILGGMATTGPYPLPQLHDSQESRQAAYRQAMAAFAEKLSLPDKPGLPKLDDEHFGHPLYVQMAALLALYGEQPGSAESVARSLINHERRYWTRALSGLLEKTIQQDESAALLMTLATLANELPTVRDSETLWVAAGGEKSVLKQLFGTLAQLYPGRQGVQGLRPDLLGEALVAQSLLGANGKAILAAVLGSKQVALRRASLTVLARLLRNREELSSTVESLLTKHFITCADEMVAVIVETPSPLARMAERVFANLPIAEKNQACGILGKHIHDEIIPLVDLAVLIERAKLAKLEHKTGKATNKDQASKAGALNSLSVSLAWQGHVEEGADKARQAQEIYERLARAKPECFEPDWAMSLCNYANHLSEQGLSDEAEAKGRKAQEIYERLARAKPEHFEPDWAGSLANYANHLSMQGRSDEAQAKARQALDIYEKLAHAKPERFEADWAMSLNNYANHLSDQGCSDEAEAKARQALDIYEKLARAKPERFEPDWARSLANYANRLSELGRSDEAEANARQALDIYEKLARAKPERFVPDWAGSLANYANHLSMQGRSDEAQAKARQALDIYEELARTTLERFEPAWAMSLGNYANYLSELGRSDEAEATARQALVIYEKLARTTPERFEPAWAGSLNNYANRLSELGRSDEAEVNARQSLEIYEKLARAKPERFEPEWAGSLANYSIRLSELGRSDDAEAKARQALVIYEKLSRTKPARFEYEFISSEMYFTLYAWLTGRLPLATEHPIACHSTPRQQRTLDFLRGFFIAFSSNEPTRIRVGVGKADACWAAMDAAQKLSAEDFRLLLAGLAESRLIPSALTCNWRADLTRFRTQRKDRLPTWMQEVARRIGFGL